jgi:16S rRNA A1518/A1519 N6-dimethyltransferase RsmA/KsgA/DIM1 with predicted DNA glycosylase/AP lyase activity
MKATARISQKEFGDFQTPLELSNIMVDILKNMNVKPNIIIEPTCGLGTVLLDAYNNFKPQKTIGIEINNKYCDILSEGLNNNKNISVINGDIFISVEKIENDVNRNDICLFIGNPPWITNSELGSLSGKNVPIKTNFKNMRGIDAVTGKSNFDIAEYIILKIIKAFKRHKAIYAFLCKTSVARNILKYCWSREIYYKESRIFPIDAKKYFGASVDACYFIFDATEKNEKKNCKVYESVENRIYKYDIGMYNDIMVCNTNTFNTHNYLGKSDYNWRNGVKHDCSKVMEFDAIDSKMINGYGENVDIEEDLIYPLLKSSDIANGKVEIRKKVLITQRYIGEKTGYIRAKYPKTWQYLNDHMDDFEKRKSGIYRNKPLFSIFSIGDYSFYPYKIAISSLYKKISFKIICPIMEKPVMVDDTCNFLSCNTELEAKILYSLLACQDVELFLNSLIFWDSKRPITTQVLNSIDLRRVAYNNGMYEHYTALIKDNNLVKNESSEQMTLF